MSIYEYNQEKHLRQEREASWQEWRESGISESRRQTAINLSKMGMDVEKIAQAVEASVEEVQTWLADEDVRKQHFEKEKIRKTVGEFTCLDSPTVFY